MRKNLEYDLLIEFFFCTIAVRFKLHQLNRPFQDIYFAVDSGI